MTYLYHYDVSQQLLLMLLSHPTVDSAVLLLSFSDIAVTARSSNVNISNAIVLHLVTLKT